MMMNRFQTLLSNSTRAATLWLRSHTPVFQNATEGFPTKVFSHVDTSGRNDLNVHSGTTAIDWGSYFADAPADAEVGNIWHLGREFVPEDAALSIPGETMPSGIAEVMPAGGFAVKGVSLYVDRAGKLVLVATDRGATWSCSAATCANWNCDQCRATPETRCVGSATAHQCDRGYFYGCYDWAGRCRFTPGSPRVDPGLTALGFSD